jgi:hypothetical protein
VCYDGGGRDSGSGGESDAQPHKARAAKRQPPVVPTAGGRPTGRSLVAQQMDDTNSERDEPACPSQSSNGGPSRNDHV